MREERDARFSGHRAGEQRLAGSRRAGQQDAAGTFPPRRGELVRVPQEVHHLGQLLGGLVDAGDIGKRGPLLGRLIADAARDLPNIDRPPPSRGPPRIMSTNSPPISSTGSHAGQRRLPRTGCDRPVGLAPTVAPSASSCWNRSSLANTGRSVLNSAGRLPRAVRAGR